MDTIILMGPIGVGKSTQAELLSRERGQPRCNYDEVKGGYLKRSGFDHARFDAIATEKNEYEAFCYRNKYRSLIFGQIIGDHQGHIIDFGGGTHCFNDLQEIESAKEILDPITDIFYLLPSDDLETNIKSLPGFKQGYGINTYIMMHPTNAMFAKKIIYTLDKNPEEIAQEITDMLGKSHDQSILDRLFCGDM